MSIASSEFEQFRREREAAVRAPFSDLSLVLTHWGEPGDPPVGDAEALAGHPEGSHLARMSRPSPENGLVQESYRVWSPTSPARDAFEGIDVFPFDEDWVLRGRYEVAALDRRVAFAHQKDGDRLREWDARGDVVVTVGGEEYRLAVFDAGDDDFAQVVFADATSGVSTYAAGRFLFVALPANWRDLDAGESMPVEVDFNRAVVPSCAFSAHMNCPLPPASNRITVAVEAGEKDVVFASGFDLYAG